MNIFSNFYLLPLLSNLKEEIFVNFPIFASNSWKLIPAKSPFAKINSQEIKKLKFWFSPYISHWLQFGWIDPLPDKTKRPANHTFGKERKTHGALIINDNITLSSAVANYPFCLSAVFPFENIVRISAHFTCLLCFFRELLP